MQYAVVIEKTGNGYSAYVPDLPGCVAAGDTQEEVDCLIREAVACHVAMLREHGDPVPKPQATTGPVEVWAQPLVPANHALQAECYPQAEDLA